jgi:hypothetical protein
MGRQPLALRRRQPVGRRQDAAVPIGRSDRLYGTKKSVSVPVRAANGALHDRCSRPAVDLLKLLG